ncbi:MAG: sulfatase [Gemmatimonadaceae bacterium]
MTGIPTDTHGHRGPGASTFWWLLLGASLAGGLAECGLILAARLALARYTLLNPQGVWLAPIANVLLLAVPLGIAWLVASRWGRVPAITATTFGAAFAASLEPLLVLRERVHILAILALAVGVASQVARFARARPALLHRVARATTLTLLTVSVAIGVTFNGMRAWRERAGALAAGDANAPNVILLVLDTVRAFSLGAYGYERPTTPFLSELAARGARFDRAISPAPWTLPSHATMFTGRYPHEMSAGWSTPLDGTFPTLAEELGRRGYLTVGAAANLRYVSYEFGLSRGFHRYRDYDVSMSEMVRASQLTHSVNTFLNRFRTREFSPGRMSATRVNARLLPLLENRGNRPFFAFINYYDAHAPYAPPAPYDTMFLGRQASTRDPGEDEYSKAEVHDLQAAYDASIAYLDAQLREFFATLEQRGLLENTLVIVTSDHGEEFNEHGLMNHGSSLYFPSVHVPLLVVQPGVVPAGLVVAEPVTLRDIPATILHATGIAPDSVLPGYALSRWWDGSPATGGAPVSPLIAEVDFARNLPAHFAISKGDMKSLAANGYRFILRGDGQGELFDIMHDPWERHDLAADSARAEALGALRERAQAIPRASAASR